MESFWKMVNKMVEIRDVNKCFVREIDFVVLVCCSTNIIIYSCVNSEPSRCVVYVPRSGVVAGHHVNKERLQIQSRLHREA